MNRGRPKQDGTARKYIVPDDVHKWIKEHGGGGYITTVIRAIKAVS